MPSGDTEYLSSNQGLDQDMDETDVSAATPVVPLPRKGSSIICPSIVRKLIQ
jgi:hypothetical protein